MKILRFDPALSADQVTSLQNADGTPVNLRLKWSDRSAMWFVDVTYQPRAEDPANSIYGIKLVPNWPLLRTYRATFPFFGDFLLLPAAKEFINQPIAYEDLGSKWRLCLLTDTEIDAWETFNGLG